MIIANNTRPAAVKSFTTPIAWDVGCGVGLVEGVGVGEIVGNGDGFAVGVPVVGKGDGWNVGKADGCMEGIGVGAVVGTIVGCTIRPDTPET